MTTATRTVTKSSGAKSVLLHQRPTALRDALSRAFHGLPYAERRRGLARRVGRVLGRSIGWKTTHVTVQKQESNNDPV